MVDENTLADRIVKSRVVVVLEPRGVFLTDEIEKELDLLAMRTADSLILHAMWAGSTPKIAVNQAFVGVVLPNGPTSQEVSMELKRWLVIGLTIERFQSVIQMFADTRALLKLVSSAHSTLARFMERRKPVTSDLIQDLRKWSESIRAGKPTVESRLSNTGLNPALVPL